MSVEGKVVIVTGAAQGIGRAHAEVLAAEGARVVLADLQADPVAGVAAGIRDGGGEAIAVAADISSREQMQALAAQAVEAFGRIDALVNNAAIYAGYVHHTLLTLPLAEWQRFVEVNLTGLLLGAQAVIPQMIEQGGGTIVNQSSAGADQPRNQYSVTKLGVQGLTIALARELGRHGITANTLAPGITDTEATRGHYSDEQLQGMVATRSMLGRIGQPQDLADTLLWLVSDRARFVTGQVIHCDGGYVAHPA